jgi:probable rRNA maturation factor
MILIDPDLESAPALDTPSTQRTSASNIPLVSGLPPRNLHLPAASTLARFLSEARAAVRLKGKATVLLTTDAAIRKLNAQFRHKDKATDVLSFPAEGLGAEGYAGDLAISVPTALRQAVELSHSLSVEIKVLMLHGLLHLAGYDHEADNGQMARRERLLRGKLGLPQGLIERAEMPVRAAKKTPGAKAHHDCKPVVRGLKAPAPSDKTATARLKSCPDSKRVCKP